MKNKKKIVLTAGISLFIIAVTLIVIFQVQQKQNLRLLKFKEVALSRQLPQQEMLIL